jgi:hypothetical protein
MRRFFVQARSLEAWHCESEADCEEMLCGYRISVDLETTKVQSRWGPRKCPDCWIILQRLQSDVGAGVVPGSRDHADVGRLGQRVGG